MIACEKIQEYFVEALYEELEPLPKAEMEAHLKGCPACAAEFEGLRSTLSIMNRRERPEVDPKDWDAFDRKLQSRIQAVEGRNVISFRRIPRWAWQVAAALILIGMGVVIGRFYSVDHEDAPVIVNVPQEKAPIKAAAASTEAERFLERSEVLLLGVVNADPLTESSNMDFTRRRQVSNDLIQEAAAIKEQLRDPRQRRLRELVSDLELILVQIASLEADQDQPEIEVVKSGVDRKGLLLKIDLEQMRLSNPKVEKPAAKTKSADPAI